MLAPTVSGVDELVLNREVIIGLLSQRAKQQNADDDHPD
jgi:hypothetical protein